MPKGIEEQTLKEVLDLLEVQEGYIVYIQPGVFEELPRPIRNRMIIICRREKE